MAVFRKAPKCDLCGEDIKGIYRPQSHDVGNYFIGDTLQGWDYSGHVCDPKKVAKQPKFKGIEFPPEMLDENGKLKLFKK